MQDKNVSRKANPNRTDFNIWLFVKRPVSDYLGNNNSGLICEWIQSPIPQTVDGDRMGVDCVQEGLPFTSSPDGNWCKLVLGRSSSVIHKYVAVSHKPAQFISCVVSFILGWNLIILVLSSADHSDNKITEAPKMCHQVFCDLPSSE